MTGCVPPGWRGTGPRPIWQEICVSVGYISRLESGQRRPNTAVLEQLASRLDIAIDELLRGPTAREQDAIKLSLDYAELSLETGDVVEAEARARDARDRARALAHHEMAGPRRSSSSPERWRGRATWTTRSWSSSRWWRRRWQLDPATQGRDRAQPVLPRVR